MRPNSSQRPTTAPPCPRATLISKVHRGSAAVVALMFLKPGKGKTRGKIDGFTRLRDSCVAVSCAGGRYRCRLFLYHTTF